MNANPLINSMSRLSARSSKSRVLEPRALPNDNARLHSTVTYEELPGRLRRRVTLVNPREADASAGRISVLSPVGRALLGQAKGSTVDVALPLGRWLSVRVIEVTAGQFERIDEPAYA
jgi:regulator of nucleoside diphosphate kinase